MESYPLRKSTVLIQGLCVSYRGWYELRNEDKGVSVGAFCLEIRYSHIDKPETSVIGEINRGTR